MKKTFSWFRKIAFAEGISFLFLLLIAMPLKYLAGMPLAVSIVGGLHGILFVSFIILAFLVKEEYNKKFARRFVISGIIICLILFYFTLQIFIDGFCL